ncbi:MAG: 23S rRNA (adenine(2503)-C(2))-methyltransferase RlmN [Myxococcota bacterium]|nr:23S rRNA (adenine(2503)-C(2))-methyltransferase RlmN [Myxococcota bacterium]
MSSSIANEKRIDIKSLDLEGLEEFMLSLGESKERALRVYKQLWQKGAKTFDEMTTIAKSTRRTLSEHADIHFLELAEHRVSEDGTTKFLWKIPQGGMIESVLIPDVNREEGLSDRMTLCVSSQWGCAMKCSFCLTGDLGLKGHLTPSQITNQPLQVAPYLPPGKRITNIVMMGMGEPLHNYQNLIIALRNMLHYQALDFSHRKLTVSSVGLVPAIRKLANELPVNLAISLNASTEEQRRKVMPITNKYSLRELIECCKTIPLPPGKRIAFEYVMMAGFNDTLEDAQRVLDLLKDVPAKVNLIPYNENPDREIRRPSHATVKAFQNYMVTRGMHCTVRATRGKDISAACGQLGKAAESIRPNQEIQP